MMNKNVNSKQRAKCFQTTNGGSTFIQLDNHYIYFYCKKKFYKCKIKSKCSVLNQFRFPKKKVTENITVYIKLPFFPLLVIINKTFREGKNKIGDNILEMLVEKVKTTQYNLLHFYQLAFSNSKNQAVEQSEFTKMMLFNLSYTKNKEVLNGKIHLCAVLCDSKIAVFGGQKKQFLACIDVGVKPKISQYILFF